MRITLITGEIDRCLEPEHAAIVNAALEVLEQRFRAPGARMADPADAKAYLRLRLQGFPCQILGALLLDTRRRVLGYWEIARGTLDFVGLHPRVFVRVALEWNAASVLLARSDPEGDAQFGEREFANVRRLKAALALIDVDLIDHLIIGKTVVSSRERGLFD